MQAKFIDQLKKYFPEFKPIDQESIGIDDDEVESEEGLRIEEVAVQVHRQDEDTMLEGASAKFVGITLDTSDD